MNLYDHVAMHQVLELDTCLTGLGGCMFITSPFTKVMKIVRLSTLRWSTFKGPSDCLPNNGLTPKYWSNVTTRLSSQYYLQGEQETRICQFVLGIVQLYTTLICATFTYQEQRMWWQTSCPNELEQQGITNRYSCTYQTPSGYTSRI